MAKVDLTENGAYSRLTPVHPLRRRLFAPTIPWEPTPPFDSFQVAASDDDLKSAPLVYTGDAESINYRREFTEVEQGLRCECCGRPIIVLPWDGSNGLLCSDCLERLEIQVHGKFDTPWQKVEQGNSVNAVPWWFDL